MACLGHATRLGRRPSHATWRRLGSQFCWELPASATSITAPSLHCTKGRLSCAGCLRLSLRHSLQLSWHWHHAGHHEQHSAAEGSRYSFRLPVVAGPLVAKQPRAGIRCGCAVLLRPTRGSNVSKCIIMWKHRRRHGMGQGGLRRPATNRGTADKLAGLGVCGGNVSQGRFPSW